MSQAGFDETVLRLVLSDVADVFSVEFLPVCASTNLVLLEKAAQFHQHGRVVWAGLQTAGRGRRGRQWLSDPDCSLTFSLLWRFGKEASLAGLSLAVGLAVVQALEDLGYQGLGLKWPNDIWLFGRKLGGVLIELAFDSEGVSAVIGVGMNLRLHPDWPQVIDQDVASLDMAAIPPPGEILLGTVLRRLGHVLQSFEQQGFAPLCGSWNKRNALHGLPVKVSSESGALQGICGDSREDGALALLSSGCDTLWVSGGDLSLRLESSLDE